MEFSVIEKLSNDLRKNIYNKIPHINNGGCGIFAIYLYNVLSKLGYNPEIKVIYSSGYDSKVFDNQISEYNQSNVEKSALSSWGHFYVKIGDFFIDANGITENPLYGQYSYYYLSKQSMDINILKDLCSKKYKHYWNPMFDRKSQRSRLYRKLRYLENKYKNQVV